jgi:putative transposase
MMHKNFKFRLYPNHEQEQKMFFTLNRCRELYNAALSERKDSYKYTGTGVTYYDQKKDLPEIKELREEYKDIHSQVLQDVMLRLDKAMKAFFRRVKGGEIPGFPRFQGRNRYDSFTYPQGGYSLSEKHVTLSKIGKLRVNLHREIQGTIKTATVKREGDQ